MPDIQIFCSACGHLIKPNTGIVNPKDIPITLFINGEELFFHNDKCKARYDRAQAKMNKVKTGKRSAYGAAGV